MKRLTENVLKHKNLILEAERYIWNNPETGYKEWKTSEYLQKKFLQLGYKLEFPKGIPGFTAVADSGKPGPELLVLGELDSLICPEHPQADKKTGAVHCCGHNAQCAALLGVAAAFSEKNAFEGLCGKIKFCAVPAEELIELEYRNDLIKKGVIKYYGGKAEFLSRGLFNGVQLAFMVHTANEFCALKGSVGSRVKQIAYKGVASHAGGAPQYGINALYAAVQGISAINAVRETFTEPELIRVHPIVTHGGEAVNAIPELVTIESYVRGASFEAIEKANRKVNRALCGGALSLGANVEINDMPGYSPLINDGGMTELCREAFKAVFPERDFGVYDEIGTGSTDMGDLSMIMPVVHPYCQGSAGTSHGADYRIENPEKACVECAMWQCAMIYMLLSDNALKAQKIINNFKPTFDSKKEFLAYLESIKIGGERITYGDNGTATINWR